jgi:hypothetical protein
MDHYCGSWTGRGATSLRRPSLREWCNLAVCPPDGPLLSGFFPAHSDGWCWVVCLIDAHKPAHTGQHAMHAADNPYDNTTPEPCAYYTHHSDGCANADRADPLRGDEFGFVPLPRSRMDIKSVQNSPKQGVDLRRTILP